MKGIYCDGADNNFGSSYCVVKNYDKQQVTKTKKMQHNYSSIIMEYLALIEGLKQACPILRVVYSDCLRVVSEINSNRLPRYSMKYHDLWSNARCIIKQKPYVIVKWIPREENLAGIYLEDSLIAKKQEIYKKK